MSNYKKCNSCPYYYGEIDQCMYDEEYVPKNLEKKCEGVERTKANRKSK